MAAAGLMGWRPCRLVNFIVDRFRLYIVCVLIIPQQARNCSAGSDGARDAPFFSFFPPLSPRSHTHAHTLAAAPVDRGARATRTSPSCQPHPLALSGAAHVQAQTAPSATPLPPLPLLASHTRACTCTCTCTPQAWPPHRRTSLCRQGKRPRSNTPRRPLPLQLPLRIDCVQSQGSTGLSAESGCGTIGEAWGVNEVSPEKDRRPRVAASWSLRRQRPSSDLS